VKPRGSQVQLRQVAFAAARMRWTNVWHYDEQPATDGNRELHQAHGHDLRQAAIQAGSVSWRGRARRVTVTF